jgi:hypothetical protein
MNGNIKGTNSMERSFNLHTVPLEKQHGSQVRGGYGHNFVRKEELVNDDDGCSSSENVSFLVDHTTGSGSFNKEDDDEDDASNFRNDDGCSDSNRFVPSRRRLSHKKNNNDFNIVKVHVFLVVLVVSITTGLFAYYISYATLKKEFENDFHEGAKLVSNISSFVC